MADPPPPPPGFTLDQPSATPPPPPPGFKLDQPASRGPAADPQDTSNLGSLARTLDPGPFIKAIPQGVIGIPEAIYQYAEHVAPSYFPRPGAWADPLRRYQQQSESTWPGMAGEALGNVAGFAAGGELADLLGLGTRVASVAPAVRTELGTLLGSQFSQPTQGDDFWTEKGASAILGHLLGRWLGRPTQQAARNVAEAANTRATAQEAADAVATKQGTAADLQAHQAAVDALNARTKQALAQRQAQVEAKATVPAATTSGWWDRTLQQIGVTDPTLTRAAPATGAKVRDIVGGRLNEIMGGMNLDPHDPALIEHLNDIRDETARSLPENERVGWYDQPPEPEQTPLLVHPTTGRPLERTTRGVREREPKPPTGTFYRTVIAPLQQGPMTGRQLTDYVSRIGARAEELAKEAAVVPRERRVVLQAQADALRNVEDAVIGHAAGSPEQKLALESARRGYFMWAVGNDAARASRNGVATPAQLISSMTRRLRGEARYEQALNNPDSPYHDMTNWLQGQLGAHTAPVQTQTQVRAGMPPAPRRPTPRQPPPPILRQEVPPPPSRPQRNIPLAAGKALGAGVLAALGHPYWAAGTAGHALSNLIGHGTGGREKLVESGVRWLLQNYPRTAGRVATPTAATIAGRAPATVPKKTREQVSKVGQAAADALGKAGSDMFYRWTSP